jgi:hypothetical protein
MTSTWKHRLRILHRIAERKLFKILGRYNSRVQPHKLFSIKPGYHHATSVIKFDDTINKDEWQRSVYELAASIAGKLTNPFILDLGCSSAFDETDPKTIKADLVICSDVIEHIEDPDTLLDFLEDIDFQYLVLSTPERDTRLGKNDYGPPENISHYREWNQYEFKDYVRNWFNIEEQRILTDKSVTQVLICTKRK